MSLQLVNKQLSLIFILISCAKQDFFLHLPEEGFQCVKKMNFKELTSQIREVRHLSMCGLYVYHHWHLHFKSWQLTKISWGYGSIAVSLFSHDQQLECLGHPLITKIHIHTRIKDQAEEELSISMSVSQSKGVKLVWCLLIHSFLKKPILKCEVTKRSFKVR